MISSVVITTAPEHLGSVLGRLQDEGLCEVYFHDPSGRIVAIIEDSGAGAVAKVRAIQDMGHVLTAQLAFTCDDEGEMEGGPMQ